VIIPLALVRTGVKTVLFSSDQVYGGLRGDGSYGEGETAPANLYARHKLEMENRALELSSDTVLLRAAWMYDMPRYGVRNRRNFLMNMLREKELAFSATQRRGITYVREVAENMRVAASLPGGVYNYGSENTLTMLKTAQWLKDELGLPVRLTDAGPRHNLWMDCAKLREQGISFRSTVDGLKQCLEDYAL
jgi:dTDP-4-dehydrorhamnose reductase